MFDVVGLTMSADEITSIAHDYQTLRHQADELHRTGADGIARDTSTPSAFKSADAADPIRTRATVPTIQNTASSLRDGTTTAVELTNDAFTRIDRLDARLGAYVSTFRDAALQAAERADRELTAGQDRGPLHGIPLAIKDVIATVEGPTRANSLVAPRQWRSDGDATAVARLREAGAIIVGKTTTNEFALGLNDPATGFPMPRNSWAADRYAGGSSSGTAIAVASGLALGGLGTDTAGSIRHPSALNGVTGLKVSLGRVSTNGTVPLSPSLDTVGPIARTAWDCALMFQVIADHDPSDSGSTRWPVPRYLDALDGSVQGLRIGWPKRYFFDTGNVSDPVRTRVTAAISALREAGAGVAEVSLPNADMARIACQIVLLCEAFAYHRDDLVAHWATYGRYARGLLARGALYGGADYVQAKKIAAAFDREVSEAMRACDVLIMPTMPTGARLLMETDPMMMDRWSSASFTSQWNLTGLPACAVPIGFDGVGMPVSMQIIGKPFDEATVLRVADAYQRLTSFHLAAPAMPGD
ncbi:amidase [Spongiactinospora sp. TRM90649]|uniref:amidase n=1 Tax=Spongiactinospora sp. TRM90649 TaxID=3031114 RepID=UPI0023F7A736|nr:amidase [Spongiactinospora sp. TRM90649]MDF5753431.1 amidase [Spongiactinospora sp. TRM90649]